MWVIIQNLIRYIFGKKINYLYIRKEKIFLFRKLHTKNRLRFLSVFHKITTLTKQFFLWISHVSIYYIVRPFMSYASLADDDSASKIKIFIIYYNYTVYNTRPRNFSFHLRCTCTYLF